TTAYNALDHAIATSISHGVVYVIAAGNDAVDVQTVTPAHVKEAITVASFYDHSANTNMFSEWSNFGADVDILAPGNNIKSLDSESTAPLRMSGTSVAAPIVTGAAALFLSRNPSATPQHVLDKLLSDASASELTVTGAPAGTVSASVWVGETAGTDSGPSAPDTDSGSGGGKGKKK
ncbi:MAG: S8 family serine peptidase, partial [Rhodothermales bacterium]|nr:S8 family serine peptidase [Rhodothermales bacterium]